MGVKKQSRVDSSALGVNTIAPDKLPKWEPELLTRYNVPGPRYTSYPGAQAFNADLAIGKYRSVLCSAGKSDDPLSLYVHIPFCQSICYYCACNKIVTRDKAKAATYLQYLEQEIELISAQMDTRRPVKALHIGGGTPTFLSNGELTELVYKLASNFNFTSENEREYSIELDPRTVEADELGLLRGLGFNRISLGVQDFDPSVQKAINRIQSIDRVAELTAAARDFRFDSVSFDLIYGLPAQSSASFQHTIETVLDLSPDRISLYNYAHLPTQFPSQRAIDRLQLPGAQQKLGLLCQAAEQFQQNDYRYIGMDHFVRRGDSMDRAAQQGRLQRSFQGYSVTHAPDVVALGVSAISSISNCYAQNHKTLGEYYAAIDAKTIPLARGLLLSADDIARRDLINRIICQLRVNLQQFEQQHDLDFSDYFADALQALRQAEEDGLLQLSDEFLAVTERGRLLLRNICLVFDKHLDSAGPLHSKTI